MEDVYQNSINPGFYDISMKRANAAGGNVPDPPDFELQPGLLGCSAWPISSNAYFQNLDEFLF